MPPGVFACANLCGISSDIRSGISSGILSGVSSNTLSGISSGILSGRWGLAVEVQRCTLSWEGPRLRSSGAHWAGKVPGWGPAVHTELGSSQVEVQRCALSCEVGEELGKELARRKLRWKLMQTWSRRNWRRRRGGGEARRRRRMARKRRTTTLIKSNNPHLAGGEKQLHMNGGHVILITCSLSLYIYICIHTTIQRYIRYIEYTFIIDNCSTTSLRGPVSLRLPVHPHLAWDLAWLPLGVQDGPMPV